MDIEDYVVPGVNDSLLDYGIRQTHLSCPNLIFPIFLFSPLSSPAYNFCLYFRNPKHLFFRFYSLPSIPINL